MLHAQCQCSKMRDVLILRYSDRRKKLRERVEGNNGAPTAPAGAERGRYGRGQGREMSPR
eukprot:scaffold5808_cov128-Isochrysis_galbana.AAC.24